MTHHHKYHVIVNAEQKEVEQPKLTFHDICKLAFPEGPFGENIVYTVTFVLPDGTNGSLVEHTEIDTIDGTIFHVANTDKS
jgi:hypothetical protein